MTTIFPINRFDVNLMSGNDVLTADIALHISVRLKEKSIVLNSKQNDVWGKEEKKKNPFKDNEPVDLRIRAHDNKFEVNIINKAAHKFVINMRICIYCRFSQIRKR